MRRNRDPVQQHRSLITDDEGYHEGNCGVEPVGAVDRVNNCASDGDARRCRGVRCRVQENGANVQVDVVFRRGYPFGRRVDGGRVARWIASRDAPIAAASAR
jgi:hypothetical protein